MTNKSDVWKCHISHCVFHWMKFLFWWKWHICFSYCFFWWCWQAQRLDTTSLMAILLKGMALQKLNRLPDAGMYFREAIRLAPHQYEAYKGVFKLSSFLWLILYWHTFLEVLGIKIWLWNCVLKGELKRLNIHCPNTKTSFRGYVAMIWRTWSYGIFYIICQTSTSLALVTAITLLPINFTLKLDVLFTIWSCCWWNLSNYQRNSKLNKVTQHKLACCSRMNII